MGGWVGGNGSGLAGLVGLGSGRGPGLYRAGCVCRTRRHRPRQLPAVTQHAAQCVTRLTHPCFAAASNELKEQKLTQAAAYWVLMQDPNGG